MSTTIDGKEVKERLLEKLNSVIEENNSLTSKQNALLVTYTRWLFWLTIVMTLTAIFQLVLAIKGHA
ncbi:MAG: hypothetical protein HY209_04670 [Candidatus Omnitrophica bacterium]|nr:hypothetical protein [Candidatus Omnitrophota bacterium]